MHCSKLLVYMAPVIFDRPLGAVISPTLQMREPRLRVAHRTSKGTSWGSILRYVWPQSFIILNICDTCFFFSWCYTIHFVLWGSLSPNWLWAHPPLPTSCPPSLCACFHHHQAHRLMVKFYLTLVFQFMFSEPFPGSIYMTSYQSFYML